MLSLLVTSALASKDYATLFTQWKATHGKTYASSTHEVKAFSAFAANEDKIVEHNAQGLEWTLGHNKYSDLTADEFFATRLGYNGAARSGRTTNERPLHKATRDVPAAVDWVTAGAVTAVKDQAQCGSCWAFSAVGAIEGAYQLATGDLKMFSEEDLVQCDNVDQGCGGGLMDDAFTYVEAHGLAAEDAYPYTSGTGIRGLCDATKQGAKVVSITGFTDVAANNETALKSAAALGPVSVAIEADKSAFQLYKSGVLNKAGCGTSLDHGVLLVGYGTQKGILSSTDYWKVKNSWGTTWGEDGYVRMAMGKNMCGIAMQPSYPTGASAVTVEP